MVALGRLASGEVDKVRRTCEAVACDFDAVFCAGEDGCGVRIDPAGLAMEDEPRARFRARMLGEQENARVGALGGGAVAKPCGEGNAKGELGRNGAEVENDGAEASTLEEEVGGAEGLVQSGVLAYGQGPLRGKTFVEVGRRAPGTGARAPESRV